jgi:protein O-mannosyl-transferase
MTHSLPKNKTWLILLFLAVVTLLAFWQVKDCDFIHQYDDGEYVTKNRQVQQGISIEAIQWAFTTGHANFWHPLTWISHILDVQLFGLNPQGHHLTNLLFHIANTLLLFLVLNRMTQALWQSAFVAALFAIHPLHVESVAWVAERKDVLSTLFWLLTMGAYLYYVERPGLKRYLAVIVFFALGLMAKPMLVTLPFVLLLLDFWPLKRLGLKQSVPEILLAVHEPPEDKARGKSRRKHTVRTASEAEQWAGWRYHWRMICPLLREKIPLFVLALLSSIVAYIAQQQGGSVGSLESFPMSVRVSNAFISYVFYIDKMIWPTDLAALYPYPYPWTWPLWVVMGAALAVVSATFTVILKAKRFPWLAVGWLWYVGTLLPVIGLVQVGSHTRADRYTYVPLIGLFIVLAWGIPEIMKGWHYRKEALAAASALTLVSLIVVTWMQVGYWRNSLSLFDHTLSVTEDNWIMLNNRGLVYGTAGNYERAIEDYDKAIKINPVYAKSYYNRALSYGNLGDHKRALADFDRSIKNDPKFVAAYYNRGMAYGQLGRYEQGYGDLKAAARMGSEDAKNFLTNHGVNWQ